MGWGRMLLLGNYGQQMDIEEQRQQIEELQGQISGLRSAGDGRDLVARVEQLEGELDEMRLYLATLMRYLAGKGTVDTNDFARLIEVIDRQDGAADGGYRGQMTR